MRDVVSAVEKENLAGIFQAAGSVEVGLEIAKVTKSFLSSALPIPEDKVPDGVKAKMVFASTLKDNEVGPAIFGDFLPKALAQGSYRVAPEPWVIGKGLESLQEGLETQQKGVSAKKIAVTIRFGQSSEMNLWKCSERYNRSSLSRARAYSMFHKDLMARSW